MPHTMMKQSALLKWTHNNRQHQGKNNARQWIHPPDTLQRGHIAYLVKFLGNTEVEQAKGIEVVKEGIRKLKFTSQLKRSEGSKIPKVELTISIDGVAIQEPKTKRILHQYPLHRISYCADDKAEKKFFSFIAKEADVEKHMCFVFVSDKLSEEITLTIGQAFDLAYRRFLETSGRDLDVRQQLIVLQRRVQSLESENHGLKQRIQELQSLKDRHEVENYKRDHSVMDLCELNDAKTSFQDEGHSPSPPALPPRAHERNNAPLSPSQELFSELGPVPMVGRRMENLIVDEQEEFEPHTNGNSNRPLAAYGNSYIPPLKPPPVFNGNGHMHQIQPPMSPLEDQSKDIFGADPFFGGASSTPANEDPFGMGDFGQVPSHLGARELEAALGVLDKRLSEMRDGFKRGIAFSKEDFSLESLDPYLNKN